MTDKYEKFKEWFNNQGYCLTRMQSIEQEQNRPDIIDRKIQFTCINGYDLFKEFERKYCDYELENILETVFKEVDKCGWDIDDIKETKNKIKEIIKWYHQ